ncbi:MAG TPA: OmpW family protein, partial [Variovorax sp.]
MKNTRPAALAIAAALASGSTWAQKAGDWQVGAGWLHFAPQDSSEPLVFTAPVPTVVPGTGATVSNSDTLGLNLTYFIDSHWAVE